MRNKKKILIISYSSLQSDPRVLRQIDFLGEHYEIHTAGISPSGHINETSFTRISEEIDFHRSYPFLVRKMLALFFVIPFRFLQHLYNYNFLLKSRKAYEAYYWNLQRRSSYRRISGDRYDLVIANDTPALPLAVRLQKQIGCKVYFDAHEYSPLEYENDAEWLRYKAPYVLYLCKKYIESTDYCTTVSPTIAHKYQELTGKNFDLVFNSPKFQHLLPTPTTDSKIRCVHHGVASPIREIEVLISAFIGLGPQYELYLLLVNVNGDYYKQLVEMAAGHNNIFFYDPVPTSKIAEFINQFDISLVFIPPVNFNYKYCLPNKFFESIQARLMIVSGPSSEMEVIINKHDLGLVSIGFGAEDIRKSLRETSSEMIERYKKNAAIAARLLSAEVIMENLHLKLEEICAV